MSMSLFLRNLFFTILQPGVVAGLIPFLIARKNFEHSADQAFQIHHYAGIAVCLTGIGITLHCIANFAIHGRGTLSPADPTKQLVISGLYRFSRNPMYVGVMLMLIGEAIFTQSTGLLVYSIGIFTAFNLFIVFREEPRLKKDFGTSYHEYCKTVRRWI
ncbi:Phospholipid methyltransferase [Chryseolinea serpens]|uniref:Phospholipid methyltransferase n=1 Tax=Chryseolinea serpens TaxID=947013 RepID=A0A1M5TSL8_9BACT|nr:isoprenylcysteine carboxylmethyltransferase family protein [Chryseolinea serpens]SHH53714.1 Phospholipid methyltransferase [Chryseolinea serpens]